jgi:hypothetical protein
VRLTTLQRIALPGLPFAENLAGFAISPAR